MNTKEKIDLELKSMLRDEINCADISKWAVDLYLTDIAVNDPKLDATLSTLIMVSEGSNFELSREKLIEIANRLLAADSSIYTRQKFGLELKEKVKKKIDPVDIGKWAYAMYYEHMLDLDNDFQEFLIDLNAMEDDPQFEFSHEELNKIADRLISGEQWIDLYNKYNGQPKDKFRQLRVRQNFGKELKEKVKAREHVTEIGKWANFYYENMGNLESDFQDVLKKLSVMSTGFKNRRSYEELDQIADRLIAGEDVKL